MPTRLYLGSKLIWENPDDLGFFGIKLRKQVYEYRLAEEVSKRIEAEKRRKRRKKKHKKKAGA